MINRIATTSSNITRRLPSIHPFIINERRIYYYPEKAGVLLFPMKKRQSPGYYYYSVSNNIFKDFPS